ncbi:hypothetical protein KSP39_PZI007776 [Platanthera zijinensis]|uniref:Uncharacterized protein n=1 Tax=Platanthera zijinensis TaxID=2320716 RepID=A0AAP0G8X5_9ASPA
MKLTKLHLSPAEGPVYGFDNHLVPVQGTITFPVTMGDFPEQATHDVNFVVINSSSTYDAIFGRPVQSTFGAISSIPHLTMKFPTPRGVGVVRGDQEEAHAYYARQAQPIIATTFSVDGMNLCPVVDS